MRFRPWPKPEPYRDTSRKRAAFKRRQRLEREALPLFAEMIAAGQHSGGATPVPGCSRCRTIFVARFANCGATAPMSARQQRAPMPVIQANFTYA